MLSLDFVNNMLFEYEFKRVDFVTDPGEFSIRGGIIDVFSFANDTPYRIEFFGDEVESIRTFDIASQLSLKPYTKFQILNINQSVKIGLDFSSTFRKTPLFGLKTYLLYFKLLTFFLKKRNQPINCCLSPFITAIPMPFFVLQMILSNLYRSFQFLSWDQRHFTTLG